RKSRLWQLPQRLEKRELVAISDAVLAEPDIEFSESEDIFRIRANGLDWDIGNVIYAPKQDGQAAVGPDGKKLGIFMMHGGASDWRSIERLARTFCGKRGFKVCSMTYPGRFYLPDPSRNWPDDTFHADGTVRTPIWLRGETVAPEEYEVKVDASHRAIYGSRSYAVAKTGTRFHLRMAAWPKATVEAMKDICRRHFPPGEWSIYVHGHSTGGPFVHTLMQRVANVRGLIGIENSSFGEFYHAMAGYDWPTPFNYVLVRSWRELARYKGAELAMQEGEKPLFRLAQVMEEVFEAWNEAKRFPQFKAENWYHNRTPSCLIEAAQVAAKVQKLDRADTEALEREYLAYGVPLAGRGTKPVPPILHGINAFSRDHTPANYRVIAQKFAALDRPPKFRVVELGTGTHSYWRSEDGLPLGVCPVVVKV
ncbi:MAG: hypothetical protein ACREDY_07685, partial [Bradyrhizobium sp.]